MFVSDPRTMELIIVRQNGSYGSSLNRLSQPRFRRGFLWARPAAVSAKPRVVIALKSGSRGYGEPLYVL